MGRSKVDTTLNLDDASMKRRFMTWVGGLTGVYDVSVQPTKITRSNQQNRYWWGAICTPLARAMSEQGDVVYTSDDAHAYLKMMYAPKTYIDRETGEVIRLPGPSKSLGKGDFGDLIEKSIAHCASQFGLIVLSPQEWGWIPAKREKVTA